MVLERTSGVEWTSWSLIHRSYLSPFFFLCSFLLNMLHLASQGGPCLFLFPQVIAFPFIFSHDTTSPGFSCRYLQFEYTMGDAN